MTVLDEPIPSAGPYYLSINDWYTIMRRNPNYHGPRPQRLDALVWDIHVDTGTAASRVIKGTLDGVYDQEGQVLSPQSQIARDYATPTAGEPRYLRIPGRGVRFLSFNTNYGPLGTARCAAPSASPSTGLRSPPSPERSPTTSICRSACPAGPATTSRRWMGRTWREPGRCSTAVIPR